MAAKKKLPTAQTPSVELGARPRLTRLTIKNFRCIGEEPVVIDLDDIVVLVGPNNVGKSSVLKAYEVVMSDGSREGELGLSDFPESTVTPGKTPEIELETVVFDNSPGEKWIGKNAANESIVCEKWSWDGPGKASRRGFLAAENRWATDSDSEKMPWGAAGVANARRPQPHRIDAFSPPSEQAAAVVKLLMAKLQERATAYRSQPGSSGPTPYDTLISSIREAQRQLVTEAGSLISAVEAELSSHLGKVFPGHVVTFDAKPEDDLDKTVNFFKTNGQLLVGPSDGYRSTLDQQGSGARRTLLWTALKMLAEPERPISGEATGRPHVLLLDEPEICLHPSAVREACNLLYGLPSATGNWQVMVTTHSPCFIDFARDHTSVVRVERNSGGTITGTTIYRPSTSQFTESDRELLKLLNVCDPYVAEFFFGGRTILVEGDTEYTALKHVASLSPATYGAIHVVRARGKATIVALAKVLNQFKAPYAVLHDCDSPTYKKKDGTEAKNPAWTANELIREEVLKSSAPTRLLASVPNFEGAYLGNEVRSEKPYNALAALSEDGEPRTRVAGLLASLTDFEKPVPAGAIEWKGLSDLEAALAAHRSGT